MVLRQFNKIKGKFSNNRFITEFMEESQRYNKNNSQNLQLFVNLYGLLWRLEKIVKLQNNFYIKGILNKQCFVTQQMILQKQ